MQKVMGYLFPRMCSMSFHNVGKSETTLYVTLNNHWEDVNNPKATQV